MAYKRLPEEFVQAPIAQGWVHPSTRITGRHNEGGYYFLTVKNHPLVGSCKIREHRLVMCEKLGRRLEIHEVVHHIDEDRFNNHPDNLEIATQSAHAKYHGEKNREKIRTQRLGYKYSEDTKEKHRIAMLGNTHAKAVKHTEEQKEKYRAAVHARPRDSHGRLIKKDAT